MPPKPEEAVAEEPEAEEESAFDDCQRTVFYWIHDAAGRRNAHETISSREVAKTYGVPHKHLLAYLKSEQVEAEACGSLPFTLLLVVSYSGMAIFRDDAYITRAVEDSLAFDIEDNANFAYVPKNGEEGADHMGHKDLNDVNSAGDFWSFMNIGMLPLLFGQENGWSEEADEENWRYRDALEDVLPKDRGWWMDYNRLVGGIRLVQERTEEYDCTTKEELLTLYGMQCVGGTEYSIYPEPGLPGFRDKRTVQPQREKWLYVFDDYDITQDTVWKMEAGDPEPWIDRGTKKIEIGVPVYNAEFDVHALIYVNIYFARGGHIWKKIIPMSAFANPVRVVLYGVFDFSYALCLMYIFATEAIEVHSIVRAKGMFGLVVEYLNIWNVIDWMTVGWGFLIIAFIVRSMTMRAIMNATLKELGDVQYEMFGGFSGMNVTGGDAINLRKRYTDTTSEYFFYLQENCEVVSQQRLLLVAYPLIIVFRLFKSYAAQPRLAMVTKTLTRAAPDLFHFLIVFISVFLTFMICGIVLFGREVPAFSTVPRAFMSCMRMMLGDISFEDIEIVGRWWAMIWLSLFIIIVILLLLNMILAIIMDNYEEVKSETGYKETLVEEAQQYLKRMKGMRNGTIVPIEHIMAVLNVKPEKSKIQVRGFGAMIHNLFAVPEDPPEGELGEEEDEDLMPEKKDHHHHHKNDKHHKKEELEEEEEESEDPGEEIMHIPELVTKVSVSSTFGRMSYEQAELMVREAVEDYYEKNKEGAELEEVMNLTRKVNRRLKKMVKLTREAYRRRDSEPVDRLYKFRVGVAKYLENVKEERNGNLLELERMRDLKRLLHDRLVTYSE